MSELRFASIPELADERPTQKPTLALSGARFSSSRRTVIRTLAVGALGLGGNVLSWAMKASMPSALANETSDSGLEGWTGADHCGRFSNGELVNYGEGFPGFKRDATGHFTEWNAACVNSNGPIGSNYCNNSGWHRRDHVIDPPFNIDYDAVSNRCWGGSNSKNAWRWEARRNPDTPLVNFRCSDGKVTSGGDTTPTVCRGRLD